MVLTQAYSWPYLGWKPHEDAMGSSVCAGRWAPFWQDRLCRDAVTKRLDKPIVFPQNRFRAFSSGDFLPAGMNYTSTCTLGLIVMRDWTAEEIKAIAERLRRARIHAGYERATEAVAQVRLELQPLHEL